MSSIDTSSASFLSALELLQSRADRAQQQITSGFRVTQASDDPAAIADIFNLQMDLARSSQVEKNLTTVKAEADSADSAISKGVSLLEQAITLGSQGADSITTPQQRQTLALQVQNLLEQMVSASQTQSGGRYIFSGDAATSAAYQVNLNNANGVDRLVQSQSTRKIADAAGLEFAPGLTAQDIFDHRDTHDNFAADNAFAALNQLRLALSANDIPQITTAIASVKQAHTWMNQQLAFYGAVQNRLASAIAVAQTYQVNEKSELSSKRDADITAAILDLTQAKNSIQAAMQARGSQFHGSLFDFLK